jgi:hypothetical protein
LGSCAGSTGGQGKLTYFRNSPWLPVEAALSIFNVRFLFKMIILGGINEKEGAAINVV